MSKVNMLLGRAKLYLITTVLRQFAFVVGLGLSLILLTACGADNTATPTVATIATVSGASQTATAQALPDITTLLQQTSADFNKLQSVHMSLDIRQGKTEVDGIEVKQVESDLEQPGKYQAQVQVQVLIGQFNLPVIGLGSGEQYMKDEFGNWSRSEAKKIVNLAAVIDKQGGLGASLLKLQNPRILGQETLEGNVNAYHLQGILGAADTAQLTFSKLGKREVNLDAWVSQENGSYQIRQVYLKEQAPGNDLAWWVLHFSKFNQPVSIQKPKT